ncbi:aconitate hydratase [uncultured Traorella sp.]|uniref:aconitate hydratase n=1 Tax=uncultured Traorella sp. TaxID=1929048 RepID=UPI0025D6093B|nr:aconitate hydratase [uncultured Traorella sp.]
MNTVSEKILAQHLISGEMRAGEPIKIKIDQTLTQDATGTMAYLQLESIGIDRVKTELSVSYIDHNTLQNGFENADDHAYLQSVADRYGIVFSKAGNGICHQVHLERFAIPAKTLLGSDSHTPTAGGMGMLAMGAGGLDVAAAMAGRPFQIVMPKIVKMELKGRLQKGVAAKDIILKVLSMLSVKGGVGKIIEYTGEGVATLSIPQRATITNMGAELGATSSIFPSDEKTYEFLKKQHREKDFVEIKADENATYDEEYVIDLNELEPLIALPHMPDNVVTVKSMVGTPIQQVNIGSCTNSSYLDIATVSNILKGHVIHPNVSASLSCGSKQVLCMLSENNQLTPILESGVRLLECTCGPCIGMGQSPATNAFSLRTFNRNFYGRSGTLSAKIGLVSCETAAYSAIQGVISDPRECDYECAKDLDTYTIHDENIIYPSCSKDVEIVRGPNIKPLPVNTPLEDTLFKKVIIKVGDNITTDDIMPAGAKILPYRSNIEKISEFCFMNQKASFHDDCLKNKGGFIVAGQNYGQGSSREHAALAPMYLGIKAVLAKSFARIHQANLINFGILPCIFKDEADYDTIDENDELRFTDLHDLKPNSVIEVQNVTKNKTYQMLLPYNEEQINILEHGGLLNTLK